MQVKEVAQDDAGYKDYCDILAAHHAVMRNAM